MACEKSDLGDLSTVTESYGGCGHGSVSPCNSRVIIMNVQEMSNYCIILYNIFLLTHISFHNVQKFISHFPVFLKKGHILILPLS